MSLSKKCVFVGVQRKSSMIMRIVFKDNPDDMFSAMDDLKLKVQFEGKNVTLNLWDTAGQEDYDRLRYLSYTGSDVFVICYSVNDQKSFSDVEKRWITELNGSYPHIPKILCGIEDDEPSDNTMQIKISRELGESMKMKTNCVSFLEYSLKTETGGTELVNQICECAVYPERFKNEKKKNNTGIFSKLKNVFQPKQASIQSQPQKNQSERIGSPTEIKKDSSIPSRNFNEFPFEDWTTEEVGKWLESKGCNQSIIQILKKQEFNGSALFYCEKQDLTSLNIPLGNTISIMKWIEPFKKPSEQSPTTSSTDKNESKNSNNSVSADEIGKSGSSGTTSSDLPTCSFEIDLKMSEISPNSSPQENEFDKRYTVIEKLGTGGFGSVYKVMTKKSKVIRAVKVVSPTQDFTVNQALSEAMKQIQLYREDNHIVHVYDVFIAEEQNTQRQIVCIEMDCMEGSLRTLFKNRTISEGMIWSIVRQIATSLKFLSETGKIIHRDIKPDNILVKKVDFEQDEIEVYLSDFGLAKYDSNSIQTSHISGTFLFLAPEILDYANSEDDSNHRSPYSIHSDIFALGVSLYQIMSKDTTSNIATLCKYGSDLIKQNFPPDIYSDKLINLVLEMLRRYPHERPSINDILSI